MQSVARNGNYEILGTFQRSVLIYYVGLTIMWRLNDFMAYIAVVPRRYDVINRNVCEAIKQLCMYLDRFCTADLCVLSNKSTDLHIGNTVQTMFGFMTLYRL